MLCQEQALEKEESGERERTFYSKTLYVILLERTQHYRKLQHKATELSCMRSPNWKWTHSHPIKTSFDQSSCLCNRLDYLKTFTIFYIQSTIKFSSLYYLSFGMYSIYMIWFELPIENIQSTFNCYCRYVLDLLYKRENSVNKWIQLKVYKMVHKFLRIVPNFKWMGVSEMVSVIATSTPNTRPTNNRRRNHSF